MINPDLVPYVLEHVHMALIPAAKAFSLVPQQYGELVFSLFVALATQGRMRGARDVQRPLETLLVEAGLWGDSMAVNPSRTRGRVGRWLGMMLEAGLLEKATVGNDGQVSVTLSSDVDVNPIKAFPRRKGSTKRG
jgi:hypothetical protein